MASFRSIVTYKCNPFNNFRKPQELRGTDLICLCDYLFSDAGSIVHVQKKGLGLDPTESRLVYETSEEDIQYTVNEIKRIVKTLYDISASEFARVAGEKLSRLFVYCALFRKEMVLPIAKALNEVIECFLESTESRNNVHFYNAVSTLKECILELPVEIIKNRKYERELASYFELCKGMINGGKYTGIIWMDVHPRYAAKYFGNELNSVPVEKFVKVSVEYLRYARYQGNFVLQPGSPTLFCKLNREFTAVRATHETETGSYTIIRIPPANAVLKCVDIVKKLVKARGRKVLEEVDNVLKEIVGKPLERRILCNVCPRRKTCSARSVIEGGIVHVREHIEVYSLVHALLLNGIELPETLATIGEKLFMVVKDFVIGTHGYVPNNKFSNREVEEKTKKLWVLQEKTMTDYIVKLTRYCEVTSCAI